MTRNGCIKELHDYCGEETPVHRIALQITPRHSIQRFTNWQPGAMTALKEITQEYLTNSNGDSELIASLEAGVAYLKSAIDAREHDSAIQGEITKSLVLRAREIDEKMINAYRTEIRHATGITDFLAKHGHINYSDRVEEDVRIDDLFRDGDDRNAFNLLYRFLDSIMGADLVFEEITLL